MKGIRDWGLGFSIILLVFLYPIPYTLYPISAADSTPSADVKQKLEALKQEIASKAAKLKQEVNKKLQDKAYTGKLLKKTANTLTIASGDKSRLISINQDTIYQNFSKPNLSLGFKDLDVEDKIAALGDIDDQQVLHAKKIIWLPQPKANQPQTEKTSYWGQITSVETPNITIKQRDSKIKTISISEKAILKKGSEEINFSKLRVGDFVIISGTEFVYVIPNGGVIIKQRKVATKSAEVASKSASPSAKKNLSL